MGPGRVKYSTHAQLPPFVRRTYAVRLIAASRSSAPRRKKERGGKKKRGRRGNQLIRCSTSDGSGMRSLPLANFAFAVTSAVRRTEMYAETGVTARGEPSARAKKNHLTTAGTWDVPERRYCDDTSPDWRNLRSHKRQVAGYCRLLAPIRFFVELAYDSSGTRSPTVSVNHASSVSPVRKDLLSQRPRLNPERTLVTGTSVVTSAQVALAALNLSKRSPDVISIARDEREI